MLSHSTSSRLALVLLVTIGTAVVGCMPRGVLLQPVSTNQELVEKVLYSEGAFASDRVVVIDVEGLLLNAPAPELLGEGEHAVSLLLEQLDKARRDKRVKGVVLRINSPGGTVTASELMHEEITRFRKDTGKPVVAVLMDVAASGGYYVACACDEIIAQKSTVTGSIGVIMQMFDLTGTMAKLGITGNAITSGPNKAAGSPFARLTDDQRAIFQDIVDYLYDEFVAVVAAGRPDLDEAQVRELADGRVYTAAQALDHKLIDRLGTMRDAIASAKTRSGAGKVRLVRYHRPLGYVATYHAAAPTRPGDINLINFDLPNLWKLTTPQFLYLWAPTR
ncbi:MAG TPA: signal peptide peptidase SppA [Phycisphaerae bacterium]|nr:signal peptide peptidase SppA [Phycisphaerae bacterium]